MPYLVIIQTLVILFLIGSNHDTDSKLKDSETVNSVLVQHTEQQRVDVDECRQGLAWWRHRAQVIASERDRARRALETQWLPQIKIVRIKE